MRDPGRRRTPGWRRGLSFGERPDRESRVADVRGWARPFATVTAGQPTFTTVGSVRVTLGRAALEMWPRLPQLR
jgi:hypothetical protein